MTDHESRIIQPTRREVLAAGGAAFGALALGPDFARAAECVVTSTQVEGPYHIAGVEGRSDVRAGKPGVDLMLRLKIVDAGTCKPIGGAMTEVWSCDSLGIYSGHPDMDPDERLGGDRRPRDRGLGAGGGGGRPPRRPGGGPPADRAGESRGGPPGGQPGRVGGGHRQPTGPLRFLRGSQVADGEGEVEFLTIYPGWYSDRTVHVHVKVHVGDSEILTTQLYFPDELTDTIHQAEPYVERYPTPTRNSNDFVKFWGGEGNEPEGVYPTMTTEGNVQVGTITIGANRT